VLDLLDRKLRQMHAALGSLSSDDLSAVEPVVQHDNGRFYTAVDFNAGSDDIALANSVSLLITNIASLKDHLKAWCKQRGIPFDGEKLIDNNRSVALVHDLWNIDKHATLDRAPRSGVVPRITNLRKVLNVSAGTTAGAFASYSMDPRTGKVTTSASGGGSVKLAVVGSIVDENGANLGDFTQVCVEAADAWSSALKSAGVPLP
jgi:hypothetical protein